MNNLHQVSVLPFEFHIGDVDKRLRGACALLIVPESPSVLAPVLPALAPPCLSAGLSMSDNVSVRVSVPVSPRLRV